MPGSLRSSTTLGAEQRATLLAGQHITYTLKRSSKRRSIGLRIDDQGLTVNMPLRASEKWLQEVLQDKAEWVVEKLQGWQERKPAEVKFHDGAALDYLGDLLSLRVDRGLFVAPAQQRGKTLCVFLSAHGTEQHVARDIADWYRSQALHLFEQRVAYYAPLMNVVPREIKLSTARTQWGCCTASGSVRLNVQLIKLPVRLIDYVVVHELAHLREMNHSAEFWNVVRTICPKYLKLRAELKAVGL